VQVVGYDNNRQAWLIKNSWGPRFADKGFAWVGFDAPSMCDPQDTHGFVFEPYLPPAAAALPRLAPAPGRKGCFMYKAVAGDHPEGLASRYGLRVQQLLLDNLDVIKEPSTVPVGTSLLLCGVRTSAVVPVADAGAGTAAAAAGVSSLSGSSGEVRTLLAIKRAMDPSNTALTDWQSGSATPCDWRGVTCDEGSGQVTSISFSGETRKQPKIRLSGQLPSGALLSRLPALLVINLPGTGVGGPLPEDWSQLAKLGAVNLTNNRLAGVDTLRQGRQAGHSLLCSSCTSPLPPACVQGIPKTSCRQLEDSSWHWLMFHQVSAGDAFL
jgi:hypothetical protein